MGSYKVVSIVFVIERTLRIICKNDRKEVFHCSVVPRVRALRSLGAGIAKMRAAGQLRALVSPAPCNHVSLVAGYKLGIFGAPFTDV